MGASLTKKITANIFNSNPGLKMQLEKKTLQAALSIDSPFKVNPLKSILTRTNSMDYKCITKNPFSRDRRSLRASFRASFHRKPRPILKKSENSLNTLKEDAKTDNGLLQSCYRVSAMSPTIDERINERNRSRYRNPYKDFDALEYERKEKRFLSTVAYLFTFLVVFCVIVVTLSEILKLKTISNSGSFFTSGSTSENQNEIISPLLAQDPFNLELSKLFTTNDSRSKETIAKKVADMRRQIIRSRFG